MHQQLVIPRSGEVIAPTVRIAATSRERVRGLIGKESSSEALMLRTRQVHTFGMRQPIDVIFCDRELRVLHVVRGMVPKRITRIVWRARYAVEVPAGIAAPIRVGEPLELREASGSS